VTDFGEILGVSLDIIYGELFPIGQCNMCTWSANGTQEWAVEDLLCLVDLYLVYLI